MRHVPVHGTLLRCVDGSNIGGREEEEEEREDFLFHLFYRLYIKFDHNQRPRVYLIL